MNIVGRTILERAVEPFQDSKKSEWVRKGLATTGAFLAVSVGSAITSGYRRKRENE